MLIHTRGDSAVDCINAEIGIFLSAETQLSTAENADAVSEWALTCLFWSVRYLLLFLSYMWDLILPPPQFLPIKFKSIFSNN